MLKIRLNQSNSIYMLLLFLNLISCDDQHTQGKILDQKANLSLSDQFIVTDQGKIQDIQIDHQQMTEDQRIRGDQSVREDQSMMEDQALTDLALTIPLDIFMPIDDQDGDGILDEQDNCIDRYNPSQEDSNGDGTGDACALDSDGDGLIDERDLAANDPNWPGRAKPDTIYAHTATELFALDVKTDQLVRVNAFSFDPQYATEQITDIAFDQNNVLWAVSFRKLFVCHAQTVICRYQGDLPSTFNGLTWISGDIIGQTSEILVGIEREGSWYHLNPSNGQVSSTYIGEYPPARLSSGDAFYIENIGTFAAVEYLLDFNNLIVTIDPQNPSFIEDTFVELIGYQRIYGLAGWRGFLYAFDESGAVLKINLQDRSVTPLNTTRETWWGAGVSTILYSVP